MKAGCTFSVEENSVALQRKHLYIGESANEREEKYYLS